MTAYATTRLVIELRNRRDSVSAIHHLPRDRQTPEATELAPNVTGHSFCEMTATLQAISDSELPVVAGRRR